MRREFLWTALVVALAAALPVSAAEKDRNKNKDKPATPQEYTQLEQAGEVTGKLLQVDATGKAFTLQVEYQTLEPNGRGGNRQARNLLREQREIMQIANPLQRALRMQQLAARIEREQLRGGNNAFRVVTEHTDFELRAADDAKVRFQELPGRFDEKGNPKQYTAEEKKELKGPEPNLVGYKADFADLKAGQVVRVTLAHHKAAAKDGDKDQAKASARLIVIVRDTVDPPTKKDKK
jgi:hypothetical protein